MRSSVAELIAPWPWWRDERQATVRAPAGNDGQQRAVRAARYRRPRRNTDMRRRVSRGVLWCCLRADGGAAHRGGSSGGITSLTGPKPTAPLELERLAWRYLLFVSGHQDASGRLSNRATSRARGEVGSVCRTAGPGTVGARPATAAVTDRRWRSTRWSGSSSVRGGVRAGSRDGFAGLGAAEGPARRPGARAARSLLADAATAVGRPGAGQAGHGPSTADYANAVTRSADRSGHALGDAPAARDAASVCWVVGEGRDARRNCPSPASVADSRRASTRPVDSSRSEVAALADACATASR